MLVTACYAVRTWKNSVGGLDIEGMTKFKGEHGRLTLGNPRSRQGRNELRR